jgi:hypothetical protein
LGLIMGPFGIVSGVLIQNFRLSRLRSRLAQGFGAGVTARPVGRSWSFWRFAQKWVDI